MDTRHSPPVALYGSLFALAAVTVVTGAALTGWVQDIAERLLGTPVNAEIPAGVVIGSVTGTEYYDYASPPPTVYRAAGERLPSQMPQQTYEPYAYAEDTAAYQTAASIDDTSGDIVDALLAEADTIEPEPAEPTEALERQATILGEMRQPALTEEVLVAESALDPTQ